MKGLLIIAHGSRRKESNQEVLALRDKIASGTPQVPLIAHAFLELANPTISEGAEQLILAGAKEILVMPFFLVAGQHVVTDIPKEIDKVIESNPGIHIEIAPYFGSSDGVVTEMLSQIHRAI